MEKNDGTVWHPTWFERIGSALLHLFPLFIVSLIMLSIFKYSRHADGAIEQYYTTLLLLGFPIPIVFYGILELLLFRIPFYLFLKMILKKKIIPPFFLEQHFHETFEFTIFNIIAGFFCGMLLGIASLLLTDQRNVGTYWVLAYIPSIFFLLSFILQPILGCARALQGKTFTYVRLTKK